MNVIFVGRSHGKSRTLVFNNAKISMLVMGFVMLMAGIAVGGYNLALPADVEDGLYDVGQGARHPHLLVEPLLQVLQRSKGKM